MQLELPAHLLRDPHGYSLKWHFYPPDVLPLWVADMDFPVAEAILRAVEERLRLGLGYPPPRGDGELLERIVEDQAGKGLKDLSPENLLLTSSVVPGIYASVLALSSPGDEVIIQVPVYPPFLNALREHQREVRYNPLQPTTQGWAIDFEQLERLVTPRTRLLMLCNPQNPTGRVFRREELLRLAEFALEHRLWVMVDELWADLVFERDHVPLASLGPEIAQRTVTLTGPGKAYNTAGLGGGVVISHNPRLLAALAQVLKGLGGHPNVLSMAAWRAALEHGRPWLEAVRAQLRANRDFLSAFLQSRLPQVGYTPPEGTYLAWLDFRQALGEEAYQKVLERGRVGLSDGRAFGPFYAGWLRLNFATSQKVLAEALERIAGVVEGV
ncbi:putative C-S lyase [Meiothermus sp. QL-1]|uniref:MalY/PatB family protein n=1 Tax=Meiothermus sp. QL-1 TaxID=2058095 RepID=UPI000E0A9F91|nr:PatB family C-S lyase [Meiothermus sp. QL-1]RDI95372.1 putative C-S lyase [Meiothermus sp. QL-1]